VSTGLVLTSSTEIGAPPAQLNRPIFSTNDDQQSSSPDTLASPATPQHAYDVNPAAYDAVDPWAQSNAAPVSYQSAASLTPASRSDLNSEIARNTGTIRRTAPPPPKASNTPGLQMRGVVSEASLAPPPPPPPAPPMMQNNKNGTVKSFSSMKLQEAEEDYEYIPPPPPPMSNQQGFKSREGTIRPQTTRNEEASPPPPPPPPPMSTPMQAPKLNQTPASLDSVSNISSSPMKASSSTLVRPAANKQPSLPAHLMSSNSVAPKMPATLKQAASSNTLGNNAPAPPPAPPSSAAAPPPGNKMYQYYLSMLLI